jgi:serine phosphatase RsbU (regulator of sigma subunit)
MTDVGQGADPRPAAAEISDAIRDALAQFRGPGGQDDDLTFVIAQIT